MARTSVNERKFPEKRIAQARFSKHTFFDGRRNLGLDWSELAVGISEKFGEGIWKSQFFKVGLSRQMSDIMTNIFQIFKQ